MRALLVGVFLVNLVVIAVTTAMMPERVAIHFGFGGTPDNWAARSTNLWLFMGVTTFLFAMFYFTPALVRVTPVALLNIPNKEYWTRPENRETMLHKLGELMSEYGVGMFGFFMAVEILVTKANLSNPVRLNERWFLVALAAFFVYTGWWVYRTFRAFRVLRVME